MNDTKSEVKINMKTEEESMTQGEESIDEKDKKDKEKPLEKMTKAELLQKIKDLQEESKDNYDLYLRSQADIENLKKRTRKEKDEWIKYSNETLIKEILPVMDNLEKAIAHSDIEDSHKALKEGVELTLKGLKDTLIKSGLEEVKAEGEPFDPLFHQAVSELEDDSVKAGIILKELQRGYILNQRLIRPAMVVVNKGKPGHETDHGKAPECANEE
ncbi:MAG: nucleotide exchange factor GrpE [Thermodesulfobacteriota bacterium]|nr:nucleotide exchange factor GrpE [Thermodesulfobacteriota bacterium]